MTSLILIRQTAAELLAAAFMQLFPSARLLKGMATEFGFYYDFALDQPLDASFLPMLEEGMRAILKGSAPFRTHEMMRQNGCAFFEHLKQPYVVERLSHSSDTIVSLIQIGEFHDTFPFPALAAKEEIGAFKLLEIQPLTTTTKPKQARIRVHGVADREAQRVKRQVKAWKLGKKRDHRQIGQEMELFALRPGLAPGDWLWRPKGNLLCSLLHDVWEQTCLQNHFVLLSTPSFLKVSFLQQSGCTPEAQRWVCADIDREPCLFVPSFSYAHAVEFQIQAPAASELPLRYAECSRMCADQTKGELWGVLNSPIVTADCAHIFCTKSQLTSELISSLHFIHKIIKMFSFESHWIFQDLGVATERGRNDYAAKCLIEALQLSGQTWRHGSEESRDKRKNREKESAPYAQMRLIDAAGREWEGPRIAFDFDLPERLQLRCQERDGKGEVPFLVSLSIYGSLERFAALLIEHTAGCLPFWLMPEQGRVFAVHPDQLTAAEQAVATLKEAGFRFHLDRQPGALKERTQAAVKAKVPYLVMIGEKEQKEQLLHVRTGQVQQRSTMSALLKQLQDELE